MEVSGLVSGVQIFQIQIIVQIQLWTTTVLRLHESDAKTSAALLVGKFVSPNVQGRVQEVRVLRSNTIITPLRRSNPRGFDLVGLVNISISTKSLSQSTVSSY